VIPKEPDQPYSFFSFLSFAVVAGLILVVLAISIMGCRKVYIGTGPQAIKPEGEHTEEIIEPEIST